MFYLPYIALGTVSLLLQVTVLRDLLSVFAGNELDVGITLALWLLFVGAGSMAGARVTRPRAIGVAFMIAAILGAPTLLGIELIRPALGLAYGEGASLGATFVSTAVVLFPLCFILGMGFPLAVAHCRTVRPEGPDPTGRVYGLEAAGAFAGGVLFTFVLAGRVESASLVLWTALCSMLLGVVLSDRKALLPLMVMPVLLHVGLVSYAVPTLERRVPFETVLETQSRYGEIRVTKLGGQRNVYAAGHFAFSYPDPSAEEMAVHLPMSLSPRADRVLAIGGSLGKVREFLAYPGLELDYVEVDPRLLEISLELLEPGDKAAVSSTRVKLYAEDARRFIQRYQGEPYTMISMDLPAPETANLNRFYTEDFFRHVRGILQRDGILVLRLPTSGGYVGRRMQLANGAVYNSLRRVFPYISVSTEEYGVFAASERPMDTRPEVLVERFVSRDIPTEHFGSYVLRDAFSSERAEAHAKRLGEIDSYNTDLRPMAYLYNLMLWAEMHEAPVLASLLEAGSEGVGTGCAVLCLVAALLVFRRKRATLYYSVCTTGFTAMGMSVAIMLGYQAAIGVVYERVGLLSAVFMAGMAAGSLGLRRGQLVILGLLEIMTALFALIAPLLFGPELSFYLLSAGAGFLTGAMFAAASRSMGEGAAHGGRLYAFDLLGSFTGAALVAVLLVPLMGMAGALALLAGVKLVSGGLILSLERRLFESWNSMARTRAMVALAVVLSLAASAAFRIVSPKERVDESRYLVELAPEADFGEKGGQPPHYRSSDGAVAFNTLDIAPDIKGYAGPIKLLLSVGPEGKVRGIRILEHQETPNYVHGMETPEFLGQFLGKHVNEPFLIDQDIDGVSRATVSVKALADTVRTSSRRVANSVLGLQVIEVDSRARGGAGWVVLLAVLVGAFGIYVFTKTHVSWRRRARDVVLFISIAIVGVWLSSPFSVLHLLNALLFGVSGDPMWLILVLGVMLSVVLAGRFYCGWLCPFGALSEFVGRAPLRKWELSPEADARWRRMKYVVLAAVVLAVVPTGKTAYGNFEPYVTLFSFHGNAFTWGIVAVGLAASLRIKRFWCRYFCPVGALMGLCSQRDKRYVSLSSCPMSNPRHPHASECIRCNYCYKQDT